MAKKTNRTAKLDNILETNRAIVAAGICPCCGQKLRKNNSIAGWWQCGQNANADRRMNPNGPDCGFQCFTE